MQIESEILLPDTQTLTVFMKNLVYFPVNSPLYIHIYYIRVCTCVWNELKNYSTTTFDPHIHLFYRYHHPSMGCTHTYTSPSTVYPFRLRFSRKRHVRIRLKEFVVRMHIKTHSDRSQRQRYDQFSARRSIRSSYGHGIIQG